MSRVSARIDLGALKYNCDLVARLNPRSEIVPAIKADAYGHGATTVATALQNKVFAFGIAALEEGLELRRSGIKTPIVLLSGVCSQQDLQIAVVHKLDIVIHHFDQVQDVLSLPKPNNLRLWLKLDTGMHRLGMMPEDLNRAYNLLVPLGMDMILMTHFGSADNLSSPRTGQQWQNFSRMAKQLNLPTSISNSALILDWEGIGSDFVRPGIMLYGVSPLEKIKDKIRPQPVMKLESVVISVRDIAVGEYVGYGEIWCAPKATKVATIAIGYADGYPPTAKAGTPVLISSQIAPLIGRPCMDMLMVDVTHIPDTKIGDRVVLWGVKKLRVETVARCAQTIPHTLLTGVHRHRTPLHYID